MMVFVRILDLEIPLECTVVEVASLSASTLAICVLMWNRNTIVLVIYADVAASISKLKIHISLMRKLVSSKYYNEYNLKYIIADILDPRLKEYFGRDNGTHFCLACGHVCQTSSNLRAHVESKHYSPGYNCRFCEKSFRLRNSRAAHEKKHGLHRSSQLQLLQ